MRYQIAHCSLRGARPTNQDRLATAERDNAVLLALADGLGGHRGGELAAEILTETAVRAFRLIKQPVIQQPSAFLALIVLQAHHAILEYAKGPRADLEPRTTCVLCLVQDGYAYWVHVGDSRLYHFRAARLLRRTEDHTTTEELHRDGLLTEEEMRDHPHKSRLLKCLGGPSPPAVSLSEETRLERGDTLLLCTDGVWEAFTPEEMQDFLRSPSLEDGAVAMLEEAEQKMREECDNLSAVCLRWEDEATRAAPLQGNRAGQVDQKALWDHAMRLAAADKSRKKKPPADGRPQSLARQISELEDYVNHKVGPKRG